MSKILHQVRTNRVYVYMCKAYVKNINPWYIFYNKSILYQNFIKLLYYFLDPRVYYIINNMDTAL